MANKRKKITEETEKVVNEVTNDVKEDVITEESKKVESDVTEKVENTIIENVETEVAKKPEIKEETEDYIVIANARPFLLCRQTPSLLSPIVGKFTYGTNLEVIEEVGTAWAKVIGFSNENKEVIGYCLIKSIKEVRE